MLRTDLAEKVAALEPSFLRFPGGCVTNVGTFDTYLESDGADRHRTYQWKETIGPVEERPTNFNFWGYNQSYGIGYLEYLSGPRTSTRRRCPWCPSVPTAAAAASPR